MPRITVIMATMLAMIGLYCVLWIGGYAEGFNRYPQHVTSSIVMPHTVRQQSIKFTAADDMYADSVVKEMTNE